MNQITRYTCEDAFRRLDDYLDRELTPEEMRLVDEHLAGCEVCAREFAFERQVLEEVRGKLTRIEMPAGLRERLLELMVDANAPDDGSA